ncbi:putative nucleocapsid protein [Rio Grande virus]|uniref:Nucleoprotein n=2 Tax=Rio Grande virus TaxID=629740 RepID=A0A4P8D7T0_9VIRU|nr:putative nucleocapsid protein [Rio Grande virus]QCI62755.1 nucleoprotein [Rio Grande virus]QEI46453.1 putative nucleocapsid protein [Rio Grande virus]QKN22591.1 nucleoprotein [Rio Grande virus]
MSFAKLAKDLGLEVLDLKEIQQWVSEFAYQGFDANRVVELVQERAKGRKWQEDVKRMIILALTRGNKPDKMRKKMSPEGIAVLDDLVKTYQLKSSSPGRDDLTLARIAAAFAPWTCQATEAVENYMPVNGAAMDELSKNYPRPMMHPAFAGLIDPSLKPQQLDIVVKAHSLFLLRFSKVINVNLRGKPKHDVELSFKQPLTAAVNSNFLTGEERREILIKLKIVDRNGEATTNVVRAAEAYDLES